MTSHDFDHLMVLCKHKLVGFAKFLAYEIITVS